MTYLSEVQVPELPEKSEKLTSLLNVLHDEFLLSDETVDRIVADFHEEMRQGLAKHDSMGKKTGPLAMIPSYVTSRPNGKETGSYLALDLGGTNLRVCQITLNGDSTFSITQQKFTIPAEAKEATLFDWIAQSVELFLDEHNLATDDASNPIPCGFTFSFPIDQTGIAKGKLIMWNKGFAVPNAVDRDIVSLTQSAFSRRFLNVKIVAIINDTIGSLMASAYSHSNSQMGIIFGTGTNACYWEKTKNITKWTKEEIERFPEEMIINMEWGAFDNKLAVLPFTPYDNKLNRKSHNHGLQVFEKMISGMYLGEVIRNVLLWLVDRRVLFGGRSSEVLNEGYSLDTSYVSIAVADETPQLSEIKNLIEGTLNIPDTTLTDRIVFKYACNLVGARAKRLSGAAMCAVLLWRPELLEKDVTVGIDGSMFQFYPGFADSLMEEAKRILGPERASRVKLILAKDGSGFGAAIVAMTASKKL
ncbi:hypothetical protein BB560_003160 [Smittium megazygosporum]|uniref:Phosphotransferase n=1 Tax=Smittium megazygosporum TaxID=133381 RepID=A0A2T9ZCR6_9FUNG|nr:hypothetical protein BB560_003160 [Smittium megazygosporum]